jgi:hypothetical protein
MRPIHDTSLPRLALIAGLLLAVSGCAAVPLAQLAYQQTQKPCLPMATPGCTAPAGSNTVPDLAQRLPPAVGLPTLW